VNTSVGFQEQILPFRGESTKRVYIALLLLVSGCASAPPPPGFADIASQLPPIGSGHGRLYIYRAGEYYSQSVRMSVDGDKLPALYANRFYFIDLPAGQHRITAVPGLGFVKAETTLQIQEAETRFVEVVIRRDLPLGGRLLQVQSETPEKTLQKLWYQGTLPPQSLVR